jgi:hypothetical protein
MRSCILILLLTGATATRTAPDVAEKVAQEARENIQIHDGFLAEEKKDVIKEKQVKANKDLSALQRDSPKKDSKAEQVTALTKKMENVVAGLEKIQKTQGNGPEGPTKFSQILTPFLAGLHTVIDEVKTNKKLGDDEKLVKLKNAEASIAGLTKDMAKRSDELKSEDESEKESLLLGVLMARKGHPESQLEVMKADDFKNLACVKYVLQHHDSKKEYTEEVAVYLDGKTAKPAPKANVTSVLAVDKKASLKEVTGMIVAQLEGQLKKMEAHAALEESLHKKVDAEHKKIHDELEAKDKKQAGLKGADQKKKKQIERAMKTAKRLKKKEDAKYNREHSMIQHDIGSLKSAIEAVKKGDMKALSSAQGALEQSMKSMKDNTQEFLHFLQMSTYTREQDCPYCKAQCLEKCHADGHSFMECMGQCENAGN